MGLIVSLTDIKYLVDPYIQYTSRQSLFQKSFKKTHTQVFNEITIPFQSCIKKSRASLVCLLPISFLLLEYPDAR